MHEKQEKPRGSDISPYPDEFDKPSKSLSTSDLSESSTGSLSPSSTSQTITTVGTKLSILDSELIDLVAAGATAQDLEDKLGIPAAQAMKRVRDIINSIDQWTAVEMSKIIMLQMQDVLGYIKKRMENSSEVEWSDSTVRMLKAVSDHYMKMRELTIKENELIGDAQLRGMKVLIEETYQPLRSHLGEHNPEVDLEELDRVFIHALRNVSGL